MQDFEMIECYKILRDRENEFEVKLDELLEGLPEDIQEDFINYSLKNNIEDIERLISQRKTLKDKKEKLQSSNVIE